ncbi:MAG: protein-L-isoaspartate O-methyltransferase [Candidatus Paceibacterota bacterium]|jgi:protein-L-isoaspartate(D-aspartate) O-methyltransferase
MLVDYLIKQNWFQTPRIIKAFRRIKRVDFLPEEFKDYAELNQAFPIGWGQSISQPLMVAFIFERLQPENGDKILEIGSGSGWATALLAEIISQKNEKFGAEQKKGVIISLDAIPEIKELAQKNIAKYGFIETKMVELYSADGYKGYQKIAERTDLRDGFDKIFSTSSLKELPQAWKDQLKIGGIIVVPIGSSIWQITKTGKNKFEEVEYPDFAFAPMLGQQQQLIRA